MPDSTTKPLEVTLKCGAKLAWDDDDESIRVVSTHPYGLRVKESFEGLPSSVKKAVLCINHEEDFTMIAEFLLQVREVYMAKSAKED